MFRSTEPPLWGSLEPESCKSVIVCAWWLSHPLSYCYVCNARCEKIARLPSRKQWEEDCPSWFMQYEEQRQNVRLSRGQGFLVLSCLTQCISLMSQIYFREGLICLGLHYRSDGSSSRTSKVKYWVTYLWILLILPPSDNVLHSADSGQRSPGDGRCSGQISIWLFTVKILAKCMLDSAYGRGVCWLFPSPAWSWPTLEQHFTVDVFCSGRQDICLKRSNHDNTSKSSNSFQWGTGIWHWQHQREATAVTTAICLKIWAADLHVPLGWKEGLPKPTLSSLFSSPICGPQRH